MLTRVLIVAIPAASNIMLVFLPLTPALKEEGGGGGSLCWGTSILPYVAPVSERNSGFTVISKGTILRRGRGRHEERSHAGGEKKKTL